MENNSLRSGELEISHSGINTGWDYKKKTMQEASEGTLK